MAYGTAYVLQGLSLSGPALAPRPIAKSLDPPAAGKQARWTVPPTHLGFASGMLQRH